MDCGGGSVPFRSTASSHCPTGASRGGAIRDKGDMDDDEGDMDDDEGDMDDEGEQDKTRLLPPAAPGTDCTSSNSVIYTGRTGRGT